MKRKLIFSCITYLLINFIESAPRSRSKSKNAPQTVYDQKQTGDYNIQLHLKDFQIIALLADDNLSALGDYDYNYDYTDFTIKPTINATTSTTFKPIELSSTENNLQSSSASFETTPKISNTPTEDVSASTEIILSSTSDPQKGSNPPDKINVQILQTPINSGNPSIVSNDEVGGSQQPLGEVMYYRRCAVGFARDKKGRCKRLRKPQNGQLPFDISRLASNLAARFRQSSSDEGVKSSSESTSSESLEIEK